MGLEGVELVMGVEEAFQIAIPDADAERMLTPRHVVDYVMTRIGEAPDTLCLEQRAFYRLRRAAVRVFGVRRTEVQRETQWKQILPARQRRHNWTLLAQAAGIAPWPGLTLWGGYPAAASTVGATAQYLSAHAPAAVRGDGALRREEVERVVRELTAKHLGVGAFEWDDEFVKDLGMM